MASHDAVENAKWLAQFSIHLTTLRLFALDRLKSILLPSCNAHLRVAKVHEMQSKTGARIELKKQIVIIRALNPELGYSSL